MYCKKCACGYENVYEKAGCAPMVCGKCRRNLLMVTETVFTPEEKNPQKQMYLKYGDEKLLIDKRMIIGRNAEGKEILGSLLRVSKEHIIIAPRSSGIAANLTDISSNFTLLNGELMPKETPRRLTPGSKVNLSGCIEFEFVIE